jgi:hypothetical protein
VILPFLSNCLAMNAGWEFDNAGNPIQVKMTWFKDKVIV